jgi:hypothetical protein
MPMRPLQFREAAGSFGRALRLICLLAAAATLAACGRCGGWPWTQSQIAACHSDPPPQ